MPEITLASVTMDSVTVTKVRASSSADSSLGKEIQTVIEKEKKTGG